MCFDGFEDNFTGNIILSNTQINKHQINNVIYIFFYYKTTLRILHGVQRALSIFWTKQVLEHSHRIQTEHLKYITFSKVSLHTNKNKKKNISIGRSYNISNTCSLLNLKHYKNISIVQITVLNLSNKYEKKKTKTYVDRRTKLSRPNEKKNIDHFI